MDAINPYPTEVLADDDDDGTMVENVDTLRNAVVGRRIVAAEKRNVERQPYDWSPYTTRMEVFVITLDDGTEVELLDGGDCCAYTTLDSFWRDPASVDHAITGVGTTNGYTTWHIYADMGDVMRLDVGWSCGNPFYYGYGFDIRVVSPASA